MSIPTAPNYSPYGETITEVELREPSHFRIFLHNDDYTTMEFVIAVLCEVFHKNQDEAVRIMMNVHNQGRGECGIYPAEVAETKVFIVHDKARAAGYPLRCSLEKA